MSTELTACAAAPRGPQGTWTGPSQTIRGSIELDPTIAEHYFNRGSAKIAKSDMDGALADFTQAIKVLPLYVDAYNCRGRTYYLQSNWIKAVADFEMACNIDPFGQDYSRMDTWIITARLGKTDEANKELATYLERHYKGAPNEWRGTIMRFLLDKISEKDFLAAAGDNNPQNRLRPALRSMVLRGHQATSRQRQSLRR